jgi:hypothetical protein
VNESATMDGIALARHTKSAEGPKAKPSEASIAIGNAQNLDEISPLSLRLY